METRVSLNICFVLTCIELIFAKKHLCFVAGTRLPWQSQWYINNSFILSGIEFKLGMKLPWGNKHQPNTLTVWLLISSTYLRR